LVRIRGGRPGGILPDVQEGHGEVDDAVEDDGAGPGGLCFEAGAEAEEADDAEDEGEEVQRQAELRLVDAVVPARQFLDRPVVQGSGSESEQRCDEGGDADQADGRDAEVVGRYGEELREDADHDDEPGGGETVGDETIEDLGEEKHAEGTEDDGQQVLV